MCERSCPRRNRLLKVCSGQTRGGKIPRRSPGTDKVFLSFFCLSVFLLNYFPLLLCSLLTHHENQMEVAPPLFFFLFFLSFSFLYSPDAVAWFTVIWLTLTVTQPSVLCDRADAHKHTHVNTQRTASCYRKSPNACAAISAYLYFFSCIFVILIFKRCTFAIKSHPAPYQSQTERLQIREGADTD